MSPAGDLVPGDLTFTDDDGLGIDSVIHTAGDLIARLELNGDLELSDIGAATLEAVAGSIFDNVDNAMGTDAETIIAAGVDITGVEGIVGHNQLYVTFSEGVYTDDNPASGILLLGDFTFTDDDGLGIDSVIHTAGESAATLVLDGVLEDTDIGSATLGAAGCAIYDADSNPVGTTQVTVTAMADTPSITEVQGVVDHDKIAVWFSERVYGDPDASGVLVPGDLVFDDSAGTDEGKIVAEVDHIPGDARATLTLSDTVKAGDLNLASLAAAGSSIYDITGFPAPTDEEVTLEGSINVSSILSAEGVAGSTTLKVTFESQVYSNDDETGALGSSDFTYVGATSISDVSHTAGSPVAIITLNAPPAIGNDTIAAASDSIFGPNSGNFPLGTDTVLIAGQTAPSITKVEGAVGFDQVLVSFTEGVYTGTGRSGALEVADFTYDNLGAGGATAIAVDGVEHTAGNSTAIITLNNILDANDKDTDTIAAAVGAIFNSANNPVGTDAVAIEANDCTAWGASFPIEDIPQNADWPANPPADGDIEDETGLLSGTVENPTFSFPDVDNDVFKGDEGQGTGIRVWNDDICLISPRAWTIEARVKPTKVDNGTTNEFNRIFERRRTYQVTILNTDYRGDDIPSRADRASIEVKYRVGSRHDCPHPQWPADPEDRISVWMHQISSDIGNYPLYNDHWYLIRVVFNSDKSDLSGSNGTPVDIFIDDQGTDAHLYEVNPDPFNPTLYPDYEQWSGYNNASVSIRRSSSCRWGSLPGDYNKDFKTGNNSSIGTNWSNAAQQFDGEIDWVTWDPVADYSGVDDPH